MSQLPPTPPPPGYPPAYGPGGYSQAPAGNNGLAIAALICSLIGLCCGGVLSVVGIILGFVAKSQIRRTGQGGGGMATAAIVIGFVVVILWVIYVAVAAATGNLHFSYNSFNN
ncbi:MAG: DUF4190 domain-containing protein [Actinomycetes bacterium]